MKFLYLREDAKRYKALIICHTIDASTYFFIRFIILCTDLAAASKNSNEKSSLAYLIPIFLLEFFCSIFIIVCNLVYLITKYHLEPLFNENTGEYLCCKRKTAWRLGTLTCFNCKCYSEHPQGILLIRVIFLLFCFLLRFLSFIIGASCANRYYPRAVAYTVFSSLSLIPSSFTIYFEIANFFRLWTYRPNGNYTERLHKSHIRFIPFSLVNESVVTEYNRSLCERQNVEQFITTRNPAPLPIGRYLVQSQCPSQSLHHVLMYHSFYAATDFPQIVGATDQNPIIIGFYQTTKERAYEISKTGFPADPDLTMQREIYFTPKVERTLYVDGAIVCARLNLGRTVIANADGPTNIDAYPVRIATAVYHRPTKRLYLRYPKQIEKWIITVRPPSAGVDTAREQQLEQFDDKVFRGCF
ncbi:unnamed protein product [Didymodactylos carnosus]|uniref:Uncharacterized protein n=1 Tax=Didymodactylos carnosus TaxID=1234261 RepID=A0A814WK06_9BILA|nr:unnamed protein product [Didymodactylos carnosus]CAF1203292.1 unnamed protein product [Didymodactylos carnosus]CAF3852478.1 unnamed protein product [Didymodactylos carnosus]CAF3967640.1 unnamed protein product [Didymodactylos carnosus]